MFRSNASNPFLKEAPYLFAKWGQPRIVEQCGPTEYWYRCDNCNATWVGPNADYCDWCYGRWLSSTNSARQLLLIPEWLVWDSAYFALDDVTAQVWEETRGYRGDFVGAWKRRITKARTNGEITTVEYTAATKRALVWMMRKQSKP